VLSGDQQGDAWIPFVGKYDANFQDLIFADLFAACLDAKVDQGTTVVVLGKTRACSNDLLKVLVVGQGVFNDAGPHHFLYRLVGSIQRPLQQSEDFAAKI